ncbi:MAG TPA: histidine kinase [Bacteroidia bacterium]|nr:histidine kinase [Bacteroidia bacterium]
MDTNFAEVAFFIAVISVVILILILLVVNLMLTGRNRRLKHQAELQQVQAKLREDIASIRMEVAEATLSDVSRDLHDEVGQLLTFCILQMENLSGQPASNQQAMVDEIKKSVRDALDSIRSISRGLSPDFVNQQGLVMSLEQLLERATIRTGIVTKLNVQPGFNILNESNPIIIFRIIRECITNAIRHGQAKEILVSLSVKDGIGKIVINDNGTGIRKEVRNEPGLGFKTMQQYAGLMNGELQFESKNGDGTNIILTFPNTSI